MLAALALETQIEHLVQPLTGELVQGQVALQSPSGGVGLGLTLARAIVREAGGDITLANREGGGPASALGSAPSSGCGRLLNLCPAL